MSKEEDDENEFADEPTRGLHFVVGLPIATEKKIPDYSIFECDLPYKWRVRFKNGQRRSKKVGLSKSRTRSAEPLPTEPAPLILCPGL